MDEVTHRVQYSTKDVGSCLSAECLSICVSVCLSVCPYAYPSVYLFCCLCVTVSTSLAIQPLAFDNTNLLPEGRSQTVQHPSRDVMCQVQLKSAAVD